MRDDKTNRPERVPGAAKPQPRILRALEFLATLASHRDLAAVDRGTRQHILVDAWAVLGASLLEGDGVPHDAGKAWEALVHFHPRLLTVLHAIYDRPRVQGGELVGGESRLRMNVTLDLPLESGSMEFADVVGFSFDDPPVQLVQILEAALLGAVFSAPFPLAGCLFCERVYVRGTDVRRRFCSRDCATRDAERMRRIAADPKVRAAKRKMLREAAQWHRDNADKDALEIVSVVDVDLGETMPMSEWLAGPGRKAGSAKPRKARKTRKGGTHA